MLINNTEKKKFQYMEFTENMQILVSGAELCFANDIFITSSFSENSVVRIIRIY